MNHEVSHTGIGDIKSRQTPRAGKWLMGSKCTWAQAANSPAQLQYAKCNLGPWIAETTTPTLLKQGDGSEISPKSACSSKSGRVSL